MNEQELKEKEEVTAEPTDGAVKNNLPPKITKENISLTLSTKKGKAMLWVKATLFVMISSFLISFAAYSLISPNNFTIGGVSGIAILVNVATDGKVPQSALLFSINLPLVVLSYFFVKKKFAALTSMNIIMQSLWLIILENLFPDFKIVFDDNGNKIFAAIAAGLCIGVAIALAFKVGGSTGGADVVAVIIQKKIAATSIAWMLFVINCSIIACSLFVFQGETHAETLLPIMMSAFEAYIESKTNDSMTNGFHSAIEFRIITDKPEEMAQAVMYELSRGVTAMPAKGMYTKEEHTMLVCVVGRRQVGTLRRIMKTVDPDSFAVMSAVSQVLGLGFYREEV